MKKFLFNHVLPQLLNGVIRLLCRSIRATNRNPDGENFFLKLQGPYILTLWHGRIFYLFYHYRNRPDLHLLVSPSVDGDLLANTARLLGYSVIRGSTYKTPIAATRALIRILRRGERIIVVADGSRGPCCKAQAGTLLLARATGAPLIPMTYDARNKIHLSSWDRHVLPLPFTECALNFGPPLYIPREADEPTIQAKTRELETTLNSLTAECFKI
jgi:hypothetical protein